jgi:hypothetical protein
MDEDKPLPMGRMATITRSFFWIFLASLLVLYISNKMLDTTVTQGTIFGLNDILIIGAAFISLVLNLVTIGITDKQLNRILIITCYVFEIASIIILAFMVFVLT